ncbi:MAG TPA: 50S ribosomal protein L18 [Patescibacteria group bacterium]
MKRKDTKTQRQTRIRKTLAKISDRPRLSVYKSNNYCYAQVVDTNGQTIVGVSEKKVIGSDKLTRMERAKKVGMAIAELALSKKIKTVAFDKGRFAYHGRIKALAEGAREGGLQF